MKLNNVTKLAFSIALCLSIGFVGSVFTTPAISTWYASLNKPFFSPPNWIFSPVWTILFILMGISFYLLWENGFKTTQAKIARTFFMMQLGFNASWSMIFFGLKSPLFAFMEIILLWVAVWFTIVSFRNISKTSAYPLIPYLAWVSFAAVLNFAIYVMN